jgi:hypothetical protein
VIAVHVREESSGKNMADTGAEFELAVDSIRCFGIELLAYVSSRYPLRITSYGHTRRVVETVGGICEPPVVIDGSKRPIAARRNSGACADLFEILPRDLVRETVMRGPRRSSRPDATARLLPS